MSKIDVEAFIKKWWSSENLEYRHDVREWMQDSYVKPFSFWEDLFSYCQRLYDFPSQTVLFEKYDFYADCILRHLGRNIIALKVVNEDGAVQSWTYDQIDAFVEAQEAWWIEDHDVKPGLTVALILPYGIQFIVGLMTALRLGLVISILPSKDRFFSDPLMQEAIEEIKPDLIVKTFEQKISEKWDQLEIDLTLEKDSSSPAEPHAYLAGDMVQKHYNPYAEKKDRITLVEATRSYLAPLRDGMIVLNLKRSTTWSRPLSSQYLEQPSCTLMACLTGATTVYISDHLLASNPKALKDQSIEVLGVSAPLQELWIKAPAAPSSKLKHWYRNPLYGNDHSWRAFNELNHLQKILASQIIIDREKGGVTLFSQPKPLETLTFMHPSLGSPWKLLKIGKKNDPSTEGFGLFHIEPASSAPPYLIISQIGDEWMVSTSVQSLKEGFPYPMKPVEDHVKMLDFVQTCTIVPEGHPQHYINKQFSLLAFVSPREHHSIQQKTDEWTQKIHQLIRAQLGEAFIPDRIVFYSLYPQTDQGIPRRNWVESQYRSGALFHKQNRSIYRTLNLLKHSIYEKIAYNAVH